MRTLIKTTIIAGTITAALSMGTAAAYAQDGAVANGKAANSPGVGSGNTIQTPPLPINLCGNGSDIIGVLNPAFGNKC